MTVTNLQKFSAKIERAEEIIGKIFVFCIKNVLKKLYLCISV
jgi:hypothetical protein